MPSNTAVAIEKPAAQTAGSPARNEQGLPSPGATATVPLGGVAIVPAQYDGDVRALPPLPAPASYHTLNEFDPPQNRKPLPLPGDLKGPTTPNIALAPMPAAAANFAGLSFSQQITGGQVGAGYPPDANGDVGVTYYIQAVNDAWGIFDKATGALVAAFTENQLWSTAGTGTPCDTNNFGDPVVLYDARADRWILTDFAYQGSGPYYQCIAVSRSADPVAGGYYLYAVRTDPGGVGAPPVGTYNDYSRFGLWSDCLYMAANGFNASFAFAGATFAAFDRSALYSGAALTAGNSSIGFIAGSSAPYTMIPANLLGVRPASLPPVATPEYFVSESNTAFGFEVRAFQHGATACGSGSTLGAAILIGQTGYAYTGSNFIAQPGTTTKLDSLEDRLMQKVQYRRVGASESLWVVHTTGDATTLAQPQWAQIDVTGGIVVIVATQQQIYAPDALLNRWMGSLGVDQDGNMALGYSVSSGSTFPGIAYAGRLAGDAPNQLPQTETILVAGGGSQTNGANNSRWGDYSSMSVDPVDDCTFWYTNEYYDTPANGAAGNWQTRIGAFRFPDCGVAASIAFTTQPAAAASIAAGTPLTFAVHVADIAQNPVAGETVTLGVASGPGVLSGATSHFTDANGNATFNVALQTAGSYALVATDTTTPTVLPATGNAFNIVAATTKGVTFTTQPLPNANVAAGTTIPLVAHAADVYGNPVSGQSIKLALGANPGGSQLSVGTNPLATNSAGNAVFSSVSLNRPGTGYRFSATDLTTAAATAATGNAFNIVTGAAAKLVLGQQPTNAIATVPIAPAVTVSVQDSSGNPITGSTAAVTMTLASNPGGSTLSGTSTRNAVGGVASFDDLSLDKVGAGYQLSAGSTGLASAVSNAFDITWKLAFAQQPSSTIAGVAIAPAVTVRVEDANGTLVPTSSLSISMAIDQNPGGSTLGGTLNQPTVNGVATFGNLTLYKVGSGYTLAASGNLLARAGSQPFGVSVGAASKLEFVQQPTKGITATVITPPVAVAVEDLNGNLVSSSSASIVLGIAANPAGAKLSGTLDQAASGGVATFADLSLSKAGSCYELGASSFGLANATSGWFKIVAADYLFSEGFDPCMP